MKRTFPLLMLVLCLLFLTACGTFGKAQVLESSGSVSLTHKNGNAADAVEAGTRLSDRDTLQTEGDGSVWFRLDINKTALLGENSELKLTDSGKGFVLDLTQGLLLVQIDKQLDTAENFGVTVSKLTLEVRGTVFSVQREAANSALLNVYQGRVAIVDQNGSELTTLEKGQSIRFDPEGGTLSGEAAAIDYAALPAVFAESVTDYARESMSQSAADAAPSETMPAETAPAETSDLSAPSEGAPSPSQAPAEETPIVAEKPIVADQSAPTAATPAAPSAATPAPTPLAHYSVIFDPDGGRIGNAGGNVLVEVESGQAAAAPTGVVKDGFILDGWATARGGTSLADLTSITANQTVYALWREDAAASPAPNTPILPQISFQYLWDGKYYQPHASISWASGSESAHIQWQLLDAKGKALDSGGDIQGDGGNVSAKQLLLPLNSPSASGLYPKGYVLRLTPHCVIEGTDTALSSTEMELPYFEVATNRQDGVLLPIISTNVGFYFYHSYDSLTVTQENGKLRITGKLAPLLGDNVPITLDVLSS